MPTILFDNNGVEVPLGDEIGRGGEACVYRLPKQPRFVAKIYHKPPDLEKTKKLGEMVALQNERLLKLSAWPVAVLRRPQSQGTVGFAMPNISGYKDVHLLYSPKSRVKDFPANANWAFLVHTAGNVARAFSVIHDQGHVIGDVNERNLRVSPDTAVVNLIDCDSFQIRALGQYFLCEVGVPTYTPPELQQKVFKTVVRTSNHDNFGLAVLVFHLLFMGRHPFAGRFVGKGEMPIEKAISEYRFAYAPESFKTQMQPPPNVLSLSQIPTGVASLFLRAFSSDGVTNGRPAASEWVSALAALETELTKCRTNPAHYFFKLLSECPWCTIEGRTGVLLFAGVLAFNTATGFSIELFWAQIKKVTAPGPATMPDFTPLRGNVRATFEAKKAGWKRRVRLTAVILGVLFAIVVGFIIVGGGVFWIALIAIGVAQVALKNSGKERERYESERRTAETGLRALRDRWSSEASDTAFQQKLSFLDNKKVEYQSLPGLRQSKLQGLQRNLYQSQLHSFLERFLISSADISNVGATRKAMLASYNIETAADVTLSSVDAVPGFGQFLTGQLLAWRQSLEGRFVFNPNKGVDPADVQALDREISSKRISLEASLRTGASELARVGGQILANRQFLSKEIENATLKLFQAEANLHAA